MPIMTATRPTVSRASAGWRDHQVSVLVMFSVRTVRFGSDIGRSLSHLLKALTAKVGGIILSSSEVRYFVQVDASVSELREHFSGEYNSRDIPRRDQVEFATMSQLRKPMIVGLLIQQGCHR